MYGTSSRSEKTRAAANLLGLVSVLGGAALVVLAFTEQYVQQRIWLVAAGGAIAVVGLLMMVAVQVLIKIESNSFRLHNQVLDLEESIRRQAELLGRISEHTAISDASKSLTNREEEREALRSAIRADMRSERWEPALSLVDGMERRFGYDEEAQSLRQEIIVARNEAMRTRLNQAATRIDQLLDQHDWETALREIERLQRALPDEPRVTMLRARLDEKRAARKSELLALWKKTVDREDVDEAIRVLGELDNYLSRDEAKSLEDSARNVFRAKLMQLGMQFRFAVKELRWRDALEIGVQITDEFPNSRMAQEVSEAMAGLRRRAGLHADVEITTSEPGGGAARAATP